jgi:capsular exopolysaccharide synthesis family protein
MDLRHYLRAMRKFWWVVLTGLLLGTVIGLIQVASHVTEYESTVTFFVKTTGEGSASAVANADQFAQRRVNSYVGLLSSDRLAKMAIKASGVQLTPAEFTDKIGATGDVNTVLLTATVTSTSRSEAQKLGKAVASSFPKLVDEVENEANGRTAVSLDVVSGPIVEEVPSRALLTLGTWALGGLLLGLVAALLLELRDNAIRSADELQDLDFGPVLGTVPKDANIGLAPLLVKADPQSLRAEAFRQLRTNLQFLDVDNPLRLVVVTSALAGEGKSVTAANLGLAMVAANAKVLVIEADLRRPVLSDYFGVERAAGLTDVLAGRADFDSVLQPWGGDGLVILPSGPLPPNPSELLGSAAMARLLKKLRDRFDMVIIDTPPLLPVTDAAVLATQVDGVVLVVRYGKTSRQQVSTAIQSLRAVGARLLGTVLTMAPASRGGTYAYYQADPSGDSTPVVDPPAFAEEASRDGAPRGPAGTRSRRVS